MDQEKRQEERAVIEEVLELPTVFCLRGLPSDVFRVNLSSSGVSDAGIIVLQLDVWSRSGWSPHSKTTLAETRPHVWVPQISEIVEFLHARFPGTWIQTNSSIDQIVGLDVYDVPHPIDHGYSWWRTHHLVRHFGGRA